MTDVENKAVLAAAIEKHPVGSAINGKLNIQERNDLIDILYQLRELGVMRSKGKSYSGGSTAANNNFYQVAEMVGITPLQVWLVYYLKHVFSACTWVKTQHESEDVTGRFVDMANYVHIGYTIGVELGLIPELKKEDGEKVI
jgi:hypothetical protein